MRKLIPLFLFAAALLPAQGTVVRRRSVGGGSSCTTPTGTNFTESFGDAAISCWSGGPATCDHTWTVGAGAVHSIVSSPSGAISSTACANSVRLAESEGAAGWISTTFTAIPQATSFDVYFSLYLTSSGIGIGDSAAVLQIATGTDYGQWIGRVNLDNGGGTLGLVVQGASTSPKIAISTGTWYYVRVHFDSTAANSYLTTSTDGSTWGTNQTFTRAAGNANTIIAGNANGGLHAVTFVVGNVKF